jgi:glutamate formiminotransferase / formiminotetrahydrofolate cyclodeaminase
MPQPLVECVPNFSEGRDPAVLEAITAAIVASGGVELMDVDPGDATNRTVVTIVGPPSHIVDAAFAGIAKAAEVIDMRKHKGTHPRFGATDVCPFVPVEGVTMEDCAQLARDLGQRVGDELGIPVYLYEHAASTEERRNLATVRSGQYEGLPAKLADPHWAPDFGPAEHNERSGAIAIGAREFLIAYNVTLNTKNKRLATDIAYDLREKGRSARDGNIEPVYLNGRILKHAEGALRCGQCAFTAPEYAPLAAHVREVHGWDLTHLMGLHGIPTDDLAGTSVKIRGAYDHCKAIGWYVEEYGRAQISINLTNYGITPPHVVLEKTRELAAKRGIVVTGSEIVGLVPYQAMLEAGRWYLERQGASTGVPPQDIIETAIQSMGLNDVSPFDASKRVLGMPALEDGALVALGTKEFVDEVSRSSPAPGGGSVAALAGSLGAALACMVANLSSTKTIDDDIVALADRCQILKEALVKAVDDDTNAFKDYMVAMRLPKGTQDEKAARAAAIQAGLIKAVRVPLSTATLSFETLQLARDIAGTGLKASVSDAAVGAQMAYGGIVGGSLNVVINLADITDPAFVEEMKAETQRLRSEGAVILAEAIAVAEGRMD